MGKENTRNSNGSREQNDGTGKNTRKTPGNSTSTTNPSTETTGGKTLTTTTADQENESPRLAVVNIPVPDQQPLPDNVESIDKKRKNRPKGMKYNKSGNKTGSQKSKGAKPVLDPTFIVNGLYDGLFSGVSGKLGDHWVLSEDELESLSNPTVNIIENLLGSDRLEQMGDAGALVLAAGLILVSKIIQTIMLRKMQPKKIKQGGPINAGQPINQPKGPTSSSSESNSPNPVKQSGKQLPNEDDPSGLKQLLNSVSAASY